MAEAADINVDELRRRARRRLVGAVVLALGVAVVVPMLLETEQKPLPDDVSVQIPPIDDGKFVNRLSEHRAKDVPAPASALPSDTPREPAASAAAPARTAKYDTRIPQEPAGVAAQPAAGTEPPPPGAATASTASAPPAEAPAGGAGKRATETRSAEAAKPAEPRAADASKPSSEARVAGAQPPAPHDAFAVQLAAFADDKGADALAGRLKKAGYTAYTEPLKTSKGTLWRVRVGPYPSREAAVAARDKLKAEGQSGIVAAVK